MTRAERVAKSFRESRNVSEWKQAATAAWNLHRSGALTDADRAAIEQAAGVSRYRVLACAVHPNREPPRLPTDIFGGDPWE